MSEEMMRAGKSRLSVIAVIICLLVKMCIRDSWKTIFSLRLKIRSVLRTV